MGCGFSREKKGKVVRRGRARSLGEEWQDR